MTKGSRTIQHIMVNSKNKNRKREESKNKTIKKSKVEESILLV